jgi:RNase adaptor protein for sRNA GlmZ degradation
LSDSNFYLPQPSTQENKLKVTINSFSYREGIPNDFTGNGGGYVFDCRSLKNPGRHIEFKSSTGLDEDVIKFLKENGSVKEFLDSVFSIVEGSIINYLQREFKNLMVNFGCTGGQHRSVYCAEELAKYIKNKFGVLVEVNHTQLNQKRIL